MYSNAKHFASTAILILVLCVLNTNQTIFSRKKVSSTPATDDNVPQPSAPVPQKETVHHWWQLKHPVVEPAEIPGQNQVSVAVPLIHQKLQPTFETNVNSDMKWVPCLCQVRKGEYQPLQYYLQHYHQQQLHHHHHQQQQQQPQQQQQQQPFIPQSFVPQPQPQPPMYAPSYSPATTTQAPPEPSVSSEPEYVPRFILANYPIEA